MHHARRFAARPVGLALTVIAFTVFAGAVTADAATPRKAHSAVVQALKGDGWVVASVRCSGSATEAACRWRGRRPVRVNRSRTCRGTRRVERRGRRWRAARRGHVKCSPLRRTKPIKPRPTAPSGGAKAATIDSPPVATAAAVKATAAATTTRPKFGYNDLTLGYRLASSADDARVTQGGGADTARITVDWRWVEWQRDHYWFEPYDELYREYLARGVKPVFMLLFAPYWATDSNVTCDQWVEDCRYPPARSMLGEWRQFAADVARRYPEAAAIEVWNEPNLHWSWEPTPDVTRYVELQRNAYQAIKAVRSRMTVLSAGFGNAQYSEDRIVSLPEYLKAWRLAGGLSSVDGLAVHAYSWSLDGALMRQSVQQARDAAAAGGRKGLPLWVTELGLTTTPDAWIESPYIFSEAEQAQGLKSQYQQLATMADVKAVIFHTLIEQPMNEQISPELVGYGVLRPDLTPKPAYCALANARGVVGLGCSN